MHKSFCILLGCLMSSHPAMGSLQDLNALDHPSLTPKKLRAGAPVNHRRLFSILHSEYLDRHPNWSDTKVFQVAQRRAKTLKEHATREKRRAEARLPLPR